jgi:hypothetical protein
MRHLSRAVTVTAIAALAFASGCGRQDDNAANRRTNSSIDSSRTTQDRVFAERKADNTGINARDKDGASTTPTDQNSNEVDLKRTTDIRKRVVDAELSVNASNVKVITQNGRVTLRGPVKSQSEKDQIGAIARDVAGEGNVENLIDVEVEVESER